MDTINLHKQIMRRVYYSYLLSIATHPMLWQGMFLGAAAVLLAQWLHVASILNNFLAVPIGHAPQYLASVVVNAATHGELITVVVLSAATVVALSCAARLVHTLRWDRFFLHTA